MHYVYIGTVPRRFVSGESLNLRRTNEIHFEARTTIEIHFEAILLKITCVMTHE